MMFRIILTVDEFYSYQYFQNQEKKYLNRNSNEIIGTIVNNGFIGKLNLISNAGETNDNLQNEKKVSKKRARKKDALVNKKLKKNDKLSPLISNAGNNNDNTRQDSEPLNIDILPGFMSEPNNRTLEYINSDRFDADLTIFEEFNDFFTEISFTQNQKVDVDKAENVVGHNTSVVHSQVTNHEIVSNNNINNLNEEDLQDFFSSYNY